MKRIFCILAVLLFLLTGCNNSTELEETYVESSQSIVTTENTANPTDDSENTQLSESDTSSFSASKEPKTSKTEERISETKSPVTTKEPNNTKQTELKPTTTTENTSSTTATKPQKTELKEDEPIVIPEVKRPTASEIEAKTVEYINRYRTAQGDTQAVVLSGLTKVAEYRANELITDFSHTNSADACTALKYGEFVDMTLYGCDASANYYQGYNREAISKGNWGGTADEIAQRIASGFKNSSKHWSYVGSSEYGYMAVGAVYDNATSSWYVCICMSSKNYGG